MNSSTPAFEELFALQIKSTCASKLKRMNQVLTYLQEVESCLMSGCHRKEKSISKEKHKIRAKGYWLVTIDGGSSSEPLVLKQ